MNKEAERLGKEVKSRDKNIETMKAQKVQEIAALTVDLRKNATVQELEEAKNKHVCGKIDELKADKAKKEG